MDIKLETMADSAFKPGDVLAVTDTRYEGSSIWHYLVAKQSDDLIMVCLETSSSFVYSCWSECFGEDILLKVIPGSEIVMERLERRLE